MLKACLRNVSTWTETGKLCMEHAFKYGQDTVEIANVFFFDKGQDLLKTFQETDLFFVRYSLVFLATVILLCKSICVFRKSIEMVKKKQTQRKEKEWSVYPEDNRDLTSSWSVFDLAKAKLLLYKLKPFICAPQTAYEPGHAKTVINIIEKFYYDVNSVIPSNGLTLFLCACLSGQKGLIKYMLAKGADVTRTTKAGDTALYLGTFGILSTREPDVSILEELIHSGCDVNTSNLAGYTPLHRAAGHGNLHVIQTLLKYGADPYQASCSGIYPIDSAINAGNLDAADLLKIHIPNPHVWDVVEPHTPPHIRLGLQSPQRKHLIESTRKIMSPRIM